MTLYDFQQQHPGLWTQVQQWIARAWGPGEPVTVKLVVQVLRTEADVQDLAGLAEDAGDKGYPKRLRELANQLEAG